MASRSDTNHGFHIIEESLVCSQETARKILAAMITMNTTVSEGTLNPEDLIRAFLKELERLDKMAYEAIIDEYLALGVVDCDGNLVTGRENSYWYLLEEVEDTLGDMAPDGCYFGASEGDGAHFGWWSFDALPGEDDCE